MKKAALFILFILTVLVGVGQTVLVPGQQVAASKYTSGWTTPAGMIYLPWDYGETSHSYPLIIFIRGGGEASNDPQDLLGNGLPKLIDEGKPPYSVDNEGDTTHFIVCSPQGDPSITIYNVRQWYSTLLDHYNLRINENRVYLIGISRGAGDTYSILTDNDSYNIVANIFMSSGTAATYTGDYSSYMDKHIWYFKGSSDNTITDRSHEDYEALKATYPENDYKFTWFPGGHCCWNTYLDPTWHEDSTGGLSVYDYMMQFSLEAQNQPPSVNAGQDQTLSSGTTSTTLNGSATDEDGTISSYQWSTTSSASITSPTSASTTVTGLEDGNSYTFTLKATDNEGATGSDNVTVTVLSSGGEPVDTPSYRIMLNPNTKFQDGKDIVPQLTDTYGPTGNAKNLIDEQNSDNPSTKFERNYQVSGGPEAIIDLGGYYKITKIKVYWSFGTSRFATWYGEPGNWNEDSIYLSQGAGKSGYYDYDSTCYTRYLKFKYITSGNQDVREIQLYGHLVRDSLPRIEKNIPPVANAGPDQVLDYTETSTTLTGSGSDGDGVITSYLWTTESDASITSPNNATTTVTNLMEDHTYIFKLTVTDDSSTTASDEVTITVNKNPTNDTPSYKIPLSPGARFWKGDTMFYQMNDINNDGNAFRLIDEQDSEDPTTRFEDNPQTSGNMVAVIDLGGYYKITKFRLYRNYGTAHLAAWYGSPLNWNKDSIYLGSGAGINGWKDYESTCYTRYLKIKWYDYGNQNLTEMQLYGHLVKDSLTRTPPDITIPKKTPFTMGQFMGFNQVGPKEVDRVGSMIRHYQNMDWMDTVTTTHNINDIEFVFTKFGHYSLPLSTVGSTVEAFFPDDPRTSEPKILHNLSGQDLKDYIDNGYVGYFDAIQGSPVYAQKQGNFKPIDIVNFPSRNADSAGSYSRFSRMGWTYAAYFGSQKHDPDSMQTPYPELSGLGIRSYVENGNEENRDWATRDEYNTPQEYTARASAFYDGNLGAMGNRMGVKNADPNMTVVMGGTAGLDYNYMKGIQYFSYYKRKDHSVPFDIVNAHTYPTSGVNGQGDDPHAASPEKYFAGGIIKRFVDSMSYLMPGKPIWLTEWGYDRNGASSLSVPQFGGLDSAQVQAQWTARFWFLLSFSGIARSTIFQLHNDPFEGTFGDSSGVYVFNTTGLADGRYIGDVYSPGVNATNWYAYPVYYYQRAIWQRLHDYKPDSIIYQNHDSIWVFKYRNAIHPDSVAYAVWSGTQTNRSTDNYSLKVGQKNEGTQVITLADKYFTGISSNPTSNSDSLVSMTISETPRLVFTTDSKTGGELVEGNEPPPNEPPTADAGNDQTLEAGTTSTILSGSGTDSDGNIVSYHWTTTSSTSITSPNSQNTTITGLQDGNSYTFTLVVTDDDGATDEDIVTVTVEDAPKDGFEYKILPYRDGDKILYIKVLTKED